MCESDTIFLTNDYCLIVSCSFSLVTIISPVVVYNCFQAILPLTMVWVETSRLLPDPV